jgi:hypothetical protein
VSLTTGAPTDLSDVMSPPLLLLLASFADPNVVARAPLTDVTAVVSSAAAVAAGAGAGGGGGGGGGTAAGSNLDAPLALTLSLTLVWATWRPGTSLGGHGSCAQGGGVQRNVGR